MEKENRLLDIFITALASSATGSSGYAIIAAMKKKFVDDKKWITAKDMEDYTALAQSAPGPMAISGVIVVGYQLAGVAGAITGILGIMISPIIIMTIVYYFYEMVATSEIIALAFKGMQIAVCALIISITYDSLKTIAKEREIFYIALVVVIFAATKFLNLSVLFALIGSAVASIVYRKLLGGKK